MTIDFQEVVKIAGQEEKEKIRARNQATLPVLETNIYDFKEAEEWEKDYDYIIATLVNHLKPGKKIMVHKIDDSNNGERILRVREGMLRKELRKRGMETEYDFTIEKLFPWGYRLVVGRRGNLENQEIRGESRILDIQDYRRTG